MKRSTWIVLVIFLAMVGLMYYLSQNKLAEDEDAEATPVAPVEFLFTDTDGLPASIDIQSAAGEQVSINRNDIGVWVLKQPIEAEADQGAAEAAASQLTSLRIVSRPEVAFADAGLDQPSYIMTVELTGGKVKTVRIGDITPTESGYYTSVDGSGDVLIVSKTGLDVLLTLVTSPPFVPTQTLAP